LRGPGLANLTSGVRPLADGRATGLSCAGTQGRPA